MKKIEDETKRNEASIPVWAKISALVVLILILILSLILPVKIIPSAVSMLSSTISSMFIPREETPLPTPTPNLIPTPIPTQIQEITPAVVAPSFIETPVAPKIPILYGLADLKIRIMSVGYLTKINNVFIPSDVIYSDRQAAVKFQIINVGTNSTGTWGFSAELPSVTDSHYDSVLQQNLRPGDRIEYVLGFNNPTATQIHIGTITANPSNTISELSKSNNTATVNFPIINIVQP